MKNVKLGILSALLALLLGACGSGSTNTNDDSTNGNTSTSDTSSVGAAQENVGAAVGSLFGNKNQASLSRSIPYRLVSLMIREANAATAELPFSVCGIIDQAPKDVGASNSVTAGTYGIANNAADFVSLTEKDGCDQGGNYASFHIASHSMTCTNGGNKATMTMKESTGVWTISETSTQIFGNFTVSNEKGTDSGMSCHITVPISGNGPSNNFTAVCSDSAGNSFKPATDVTCTDA